MNNKRPAVTAEQALIDKIERLLPQLAIGRPCACCSAHWLNIPAVTVIKHITNTYPDVVYMLENLTPVCAACAAKDHFDFWHLDAFRAVRKKQSSGSFAGRCIARGKTQKQALQEIYLSLKKEVLL